MSGSLRVALVQLDADAPPGQIAPILAEAAVATTSAEEMASADGLILLGSGAGAIDEPRTELAAADPVTRGLGAGLPVMEWHDDAIELPAEAEILARCLRNRVQACRIGPSCHGLRFHPGATTEIVRRWAVLRATARNNPAVPVRIGAEIVRHQERAEVFGRSVLEGWLSMVRSGSTV
jgi:hypothetical protein